MKRIMKGISILLVLSLLFLASCSSSDNEAATGGDKDKIELNYWVPFSGSDGEFMEGMVKEFNESQDDIEVEFMNNNWQDYYPKLKTALVSDSAPDIAVSHVSNLAELLPTDKIESLNELAEEAGIDWTTYSENQVNAVKFDDDYYAVPLDTHALIMFYNNKYLDEAGLLNDDGSLAYEKSPEGFTNMLRELEEKLPDDVLPLVIGSNNIFTFWVWHGLLTQQGVNYMDDGSIDINSKESQEVMSLLKTWLDEGLMPADIGDNSYDIFKTQDAAITFTGVWATGNFETEDDLDFSAVPFPQLYDEPSAWGDSHTLIIPKQDNKDKQIAAVKFADWLADNGAMWAEAGHVPTKPNVIESEEYQEMHHRSDYADVMDIVEYVPTSDRINAVNDIILESLVNINYGHVSVEEGLDEAQKQVEALLDE